jgi:FkbM family methyltransferase
VKATLLATAVRSFIWRIGRKLYTYARRDGENDPHINGEYWLLRQILKQPNPGATASVLLDIGANKGDWSAQALELGAQCANRSIQIHAFEPSQATRSLLTKRFRESEAIAIEPFAVSDSIGEANFYSNDDGAGTNSMSPVSGQRYETVQLVTLDHFLDDRSMRRVVMAKIDTEGFDFVVLKGAEKALAEGIIEVVQFEYNWRWLINHASLRDVFELIANKPYRFGKLTNHIIELHREWHFELDRYFENNYVLIHKNSELLEQCTEMHFDASNAIRTSRA